MRYKKNLIVISENDVHIGENYLITPTKDIVEHIIDILLPNGPANGFVICTGVYRLLRERGVDFSLSREVTRRFRNSLVDQVFFRLSEVIPETINPLETKLTAFEFEVDGYNINVNFQESGIDFYSTKRLHFDIVEPLSSNLYGPNININGGFPVFADCKSYCAKSNTKIDDIIEKIPGSRIVSIKNDHYLNILDQFTYCYEVDMTWDMPFSIYVNRVREVGILHGATNPAKIDVSADCFRPISHYSFDNHDEIVTNAWYEQLGLTNTRLPGNPSEQKPLIPKETKKNITLKIINDGFC